MSINNNASPVGQAKILVNHLTHSDLLLSSHFNRILMQRLHQPIAGFGGSVFPLYKLACLVGETWVEEDVVNALGELVYFKYAATVEEASSNPPSVLLPTLFFNEAKYVLDNGLSGYPPTVVALRERLYAAPTTINLVACSGNHYTCQKYKDGALEHKDSLSNPPGDNVLRIFQWLLDGLGHPIPSQICNVTVPRQIKAMGSCGIAALNFAEMDMDPFAGLWTDSCSLLHRNEALKKLIIYHLVAVSRPQVYLAFSFIPERITHDNFQVSKKNWVKPCFRRPLPEINDTLDPVNGSAGYDYDYNLYIPTVCYYLILAPYVLTTWYRLFTQFMNTWMLKSQVF